MVHGLYTTLGENLKGLDSDLLSSPVGEVGVAFMLDNIPSRPEDPVIYLLYCEQFKL